MPQTGSLRAEFLADHRRMIKGLERVREAVDANRPADAHAIADEVDRVAGPHIAFEEEVLYPSLRRILGDRDVSRLYEEHGEGEDVIRDLVRRTDPRPFGREERQRALDHIAVMQDHALTCGTLLSHVEQMDDVAQAEMLDRLLELRANPVRWTELPVGSGTGRQS